MFPAVALLVVQLAPVTVDSTSSLYRATIARAPGQERVADTLARWRLEVHARWPEAPAETFWSCSYPHRDTPRWHFLTDDGLSFVALDREYSEARSLVSVWRMGERVAELSSTQLAVDRSRLPRADSHPWLADMGPRLDWGETSLGPQPYLVLPLAYEEVRYVDLTDGSVRADLGEWSEPWAEPPASRVEKPGLRACLTERFSLPAQIRWGETLEVRVGGNHATPNWMFVGFELALDPEDPAQIVLTPISAPPPKGTSQTIERQHFDAVGHVKGLMPGRYRLRIAEAAAGVDPQPFEVLPARPFLEYERKGGIAGIDQVVRVYPTGVVVDEWRSPQRDPPRRYFVLSVPQARRLADAAREVSAGSQRADPRVQDGMRCAITVWDGDKPRRAEFSDVGASGVLRQISELVLR